MSLVLSLYAFSGNEQKAELLDSRSDARDSLYAHGWRICKNMYGVCFWLVSIVRPERWPIFIEMN
jgi:hypothetical protein